MKLKIVMVVMVLVVCMGYQGYAQNDTETIKLSVLYDDPIVEDPDTTQLTQKQIKRILKKGELLMCKVDTLIEQEEYYVKNMIIALPKDPVFEHAYIQSSIYYVGGEKKIHCDYFLMEERTDKYIEINKDIFIACNLKKLSKYLDRKIRKTDLKECEKGYIPLDGLPENMYGSITPQFLRSFFIKDNLSVEKKMLYGCACRSYRFWILVRYREYSNQFSDQFTQDWIASTK